MTANQSSMIAELQDLYREKTNFSTGVSKQSLIDSANTVLIYTSKKSETKIFNLLSLQLKVWVTALQKYPENSAAVEGDFWLGLGACLLHHNSTA